MAFNLSTQDIPHYSYADYELWEGDWELIKGIPYAMAPAPGWFHQDFGGEFVALFKQAINNTKLTCDCKVLYECDWIVNNDTVVRPDVMIVCGKIEGNYPTKPPVLILEILSPGTMLKDRNTKFNLYQAYGVKYYLMANLDQRVVEIYTLLNNHYEQTGNTRFVFTNTCTVEADVKQLFV